MLIRNKTKEYDSNNVPYKTKEKGNGYDTIK